MSLITTHVLDTARGRPASGIPVQLTDRDGAVLGRGETDADGRISELGPRDLEPGTYRLHFDVGSYLEAHVGEGRAFYPEIAIAFRVAAGEAHYHVPLLLSPFGYSTYRGS